MDDDIALLVDLHRDGRRQGPGGDPETRRALDLAGLRGRSGLRIADLGCGVGAAARLLAAELDAHITAIDLQPAFLDALRRGAAADGVAHRVSAAVASMDAPPFAPASLDAIWSEGAIYNIGFEAGLRAWRAYLKPGGVLAVSELTWLTSARPEALTRHWAAEYPEVGLASEKIAALERSGYAPIGFFALPPECWLANYYEPLEARFDAFLARRKGSDRARAIVAGERREIDLYRRHQAFVSYGFYVARRADEA